MEIDNDAHGRTNEAICPRASPAVGAIVRREAAYLRETLTAWRVFRIHAQYLLYRQSRLDVEWEYSLSKAAIPVSTVLILGLARAPPTRPLALEGFRTLCGHRSVWVLGLGDLE